MSATIQLYVKRQPRGAFLKLQGRSGTIYDTAHFNDKNQRHETKQFDLGEFQDKILKDIEEFPSQLRWWPVITVPEAGEEVKRLTDSLSDATAEIARMKSEYVNTTLPFVNDDLNSGPVGSPFAATAPITLPDKFRDLRALAIERGVMPAGNPTKDELIALLSPKPEPAAETVPEPAAETAA